MDRGVSLVGPHRDDLTLMIGPLPVKGYASHGESWSFALALRLASYDLLRADGDDLERALLDAIAARRKEELDRGISLVGPHRDELLLTLGDPELRLPVKGYASHGESWSFALALRLASYDLLRADGDDPILVLDDVFAELDAERRQQLAELVAGAEQVLVTAAVAADVPAALQGVRYLVADGTVTRDD